MQQLGALKLRPGDKAADLRAAAALRMAIGPMFQAVLIARLATAPALSLHSNLPYLLGGVGAYPADRL